MASHSKSTMIDFYVDGIDQDALCYKHGVALQKRRTGKQEEILEVI